MTGPTKPVKEETVYVCQGCYSLVELAPGGSAYRHDPSGRHTHLDYECVKVLNPGLKYTEWKAMLK